MKKNISVLFVCLGNICRSPMAEGIFIDLVKKAGLEDKFYIESAGTSSYHIGSLPDQRMQETALAYGITLESRARQITAEDLNKFDYILAMDDSNMEEIRKLEAMAVNAEIFLMREFDDERDAAGVPDPYFGGIEGFDNVYNILKRSCSNFLQFLRSRHDEL